MPALPSLNCTNLPQLRNDARRSVLRFGELTQMAISSAEMWHRRSERNNSFVASVKFRTMKHFSELTGTSFRKSVARYRRRHTLIPILMIVLGSVLLLYNLKGVAWWLLTPYNMSMRARVEWARYVNKVASPSLSSRIDVLRKPVPLVGGNGTENGRMHAPMVMIGVFMMDTPHAAFARKILRLIFPPSEVLLRFVICRPTEITMQEADVLAVNMEENMNNGKTQKWFAYAVLNLPPSVEAVFKMDDDVMFCWSHLRSAIKRSRKNKFAYYGRYIDHAECGQYFHCPPEHCNGRAKFEGDCFYYMQGGLYGFSSALLKQVVDAPMFLTEQEVTWHEDIMAGQWVNQTKSRTSVAEVPFWPYHDKSIVNVDPPEYENIVKAYGDALWHMKCVAEYVNIMTELELLHVGARYYNVARLQ